MNGSYSPLLVIASIVVAIAASYTALDLAGRVSAAQGRTRIAWLTGGSVAMGIGIWSMHFVAMLAFRLPVDVGYHVPQVLLSAAVAVLASFFALSIASRAKLRIVTIVMAGALMGPAIAGMHYIGMAAMWVPADLSYRTALVVASVAIAITASCVALWLAFRFARHDHRALSWPKFGSAVTMGLAIAGMHYTAMAAARFGAARPVAMAPDEHVIASTGLAAATVVAAVLILGIALIGAMVDRRFQSERQTVSRLATVLDATTDYAGTADATGRFLYLNRAGRQMLGWGLDEDITRFTLMDIYPPRLREDVARDVVPQAIREGVWSGETFFLHRDGHEIPVSLVGLAHKSPTGEVEFLSGVARDISQQVAIRAALEAARADAERAGAAKTTFLANMSHEIRTPLNGIMGMLELMLDTELTPEQRRQADLISISADSLLSIVNDVLDLSKIEAGQLELEDVPFDLHSLVDSAVRLHAVRAAEKSIELLYEMPPAVPSWVRGDPSRLRQVLTNLIGNAVKFTHEGEVVLTLGATPRGVAFSVRDTGIGIPQEQQIAIFQPFKQADASTTRKYGGTGLGLSIARRLVDLMGGEIQVTSKLGAGTEFSFEVPLPGQVRAEAGPAQMAGETLRHTRALVVDDNATNRRLVREMLGSVGCAVDEAAGGEAALRQLRSARVEGSPYHLLITDLLMPDQDGFELARLVRADPALAETRIMLLTSAGRRGDGQRARELGVAAYLLKPISRVELLEAVVTVLGDAIQQRTSLVTRSSIEETRQGRRILLAEDNPVNQQVAAAMLRKRGHHVDIVENGREAVEAATTGTYDLVLMDVQMPELDGLGATAQIRAQVEATRLPIIALTANALPEERQRCFDSGMDGYLAKPFKAHELFAIVENWGLASATSVPKPSGPVDRERFRTELREAGVEELMDHLVRTFLEDAPKRMAALESAAASGTASDVRAVAHAYKSAASTIHAHGLAGLLDEAEAAGRESKMDRLPGLMTRLRDEHKAVLTQLDQP